MVINKELLKGSTVILILTMLNKKAMYGYEMIKEIEVTSEGVFNFKEGTLYPILHALEADKMVECYWMEAEGRKRKYYKITILGGKYLSEKQEEWNTFKSAVDKIILKGAFMGC